MQHAIGVSSFQTVISALQVPLCSMLGIGELLEEWTHKKSVDDLARTMSLNVGKVWLSKRWTGSVSSDFPDQSRRQSGMIHMGNIIPFDGVVAEGEAMVNQASLTGESVPVRKTVESTCLRRNRCGRRRTYHSCKRGNGGSSRFEKIVKMIEDSEKLKSGAREQSRASGR